MTRTLSRLLSAVSMVAATLAGAAEPLPPQDRPEAFRKLDTNGDGLLSRQEAAAHPEVIANFDKADRNRDGRLSLEEFETVPLNRSDQPGAFRAPERG